jgi:hypothetical protein
MVGQLVHKCSVLLRNRIGCVSLLVVAASCGKKEESVDLSKFSGLYSSYLKSCSECHEPNNIVYKDQVKNLDLSTEDAAYASLTSIADIPRLSGLGCTSVRYVQAGAASKSILYAILDSSTADSFDSGACKPLKHTQADGGVANSPSAEQKQAIAEWINKGAARR